MSSDGDIVIAADFLSRLAAHIPRSASCLTLLHMPDPEDTYRAVLVRAAELLGGAALLARRLQVPMPELTRWLAGDGTPSMGTFLKVIDILLEDSRGLKFGPSRKSS